jgi:phosphatidate cytidylyltransferase
MPRFEDAAAALPAWALPSVLRLGGLLALALGALAWLRLRRGAAATAVLFARWRTWVAAAVAVTAAALLGVPGVAGLAVGLGCGGAAEYARLARLRRADGLALAAGAGLAPLAAALAGVPGAAAAALVGLLAATLPPLLAGDVADGPRRLGATALGLAWLGGAGAALVLLASHPRGGPGLVLAVALAVALSDVAAFLVGRAVGGPALAPSVSPAKTWAGAAGNLLGAAVGLALLAPWVSYPLPAPLLAAVLAAGALWGDLLESLLKRGAGVLDAGRFLPGFGGLLDRIDSLAVAAPLALLLLASLDLIGSAGRW